MCYKCTLCVETGGLTYLEQLQTEAFKAHVKKGNPASYRYRIKYMRDPSALELPDNYQISYHRHRNLRNSFSKLPEEAQLEFTTRLTQGLNHGYWEVVPEQEALQLQQLPGPGVGGPGPGQGGNMTLAGWEPWPGQGGNMKHEDLLGGSTPSDEKMSTRHP